MIKAVIFGIAGLTLSEPEAAFFKEHNPLGFILFKRNVDTPVQVTNLVKSLRACVGREDAPVLIDQEGGRVRRLMPPHWRETPPLKTYGDLFTQNPDSALRACYLHHRLIAHDLMALGIDVSCAPMLDTRVEGAHDIVGDRAFSTDPEINKILGAEAIKGLHEGGVISIIKHIPTHGPAACDSHLDLPRVEWSLDQLRPHFDVFKANNHAPWAMTAHIVYEAIDSELPATCSPKVIQDIIRGEIGFEGFLVSDDLGMKALEGSWASKAEMSLKAGCDAVLHCSGEMVEMEDVIQGVGPLEDQSLKRLNRTPPLKALPFHSQKAQDELDELIGLRKAS